MSDGLNQLSLLEWEQPGARNRDPSTALDAANSAAKWAHKGRLDVLIALYERPMTDHELGAKLGRPQTSAGKRRGECRDAGYVEIALDGKGNEVKRPSPTGSLALVWQLTAAGRAFFEQHQRAA